MADQADTEELSEEVQETFLLHNRTFQRYSVSNNIYFAPVDEDETIRLRIQHVVLSMLFDQRTIFPPVTAPRRVLDCGFGTGEWALQVAWQHPRCEVRGIDITPHHHNPEESLENLYLDIDDLNMSFQFPSNHFDLVNSRLVAGGLNSDRWTGYIRDILKCLRPGGWVQMVEIDLNAQSDNGALADNSALRQWSQTYLYAMEQCKNPRAPRRLGHWLRSAGFTDVDERMIPLPMCGWSESEAPAYRQMRFRLTRAITVDQREYDIGTSNQENVRMLLSSLALYPFTSYLDMTITEFHVLVAQARAEAANPALKVGTVPPPLPQSSSAKKMPSASAVFSIICLRWEEAPSITFEIEPQRLRHVCDHLSNIPDQRYVTRIGGK
ncbi:S-adenosyl-L-methionine-dependent methyltransferase [Xylariaceae sp. FL1272]|nr:S-adenosyl-L-methionine-dependent methyltransferase [Xylariaceae sp. FL1272]